VDDVGVIQSRGSLGFLDEPALALAAGGSIRPQDFDGHRPVEMGIESPVDDTHAALAELCFNPVMAKGLTDHWVHFRTSLPSGSKGQRGMTHQVNGHTFIKAGPSKLECRFDGNWQVDLSASSCRVTQLVDLAHLDVRPTAIGAISGFKPAKVSVRLFFD
jgi:hypothetical protein